MHHLAGPHNIIPCGIQEVGGNETDISIEVKPIKLRGEIYLPSPEVLSDLLGCTSDDNLLFMLEDNKIVVYNKRLIENELCPRCQLVKKKNKCASCGEVVCANCYNHLWGVCKKCIKK